MNAIATPPLPTREAILAAAARVFARVGYRAATMQAIAGEAGFTPPTLYAHFGSKQGLLEALVGELLGDLWTLLGRELPEGLSLRQRLELRVRELLELAAERRDVFALVILRPYDLPLLAEHEGDDVRLEQYWEALFARHGDELGDRTATEAARVMEGVLYAFVKAWIRTGEQTLVDQTRRIVDLVLEGIAPSTA